jgi:hypothetical protein
MPRTIHHIKEIEADLAVPGQDRCWPVALATHLVEDRAVTDVAPVDETRQRRQWRMARSQRDFRHRWRTLLGTVHQAFVRQQGELVGHR